MTTVENYLHKHLVLHMGGVEQEMAEALFEVAGFLRSCNRDDGPYGPEGAAMAEDLMRRICLELDIDGKEE